VRNRLQSLLILLVFLGLVAVAAGKVEILLQVNPGSSNLGALIKTPEFMVLGIISLVMAFALPLFSPIAGSLLTFICMMPVYYMGFQIHSPRPLIPM